MIYHRLKIHHAVECHQFGFSLIKRTPILTVYCFWLDGLLIDTAQYRCEERVIQTFQNKKIEQIVLTHWHEDHIGNVSALAQIHPTKVFAHPLTAEKLRTGYAILPYEKYIFGSVKPYSGTVYPFGKAIETNKYRLLPIWTPGHTDDHTVFLEPQQGWLFSGDLFINRYIKLFRKGEDFWQQVASLKTILQYDFEVLFCGHNPKFKNGKHFIQQKLQYFEDLGGQVRHLHAKGLNTTEIRTHLNMPENWLARLVTANDGGVSHLVDSIIRTQPLS